jgi:hypothetical protein
LFYNIMTRATSSNRRSPAARQQHPTEDAAWGKPVLDSLARLSAEPEAVMAAISAHPDGFDCIWEPISDWLPQPNKRPAGKALKVLLRNGLLFDRMLVSSCKPPAARMTNYDLQIILQAADSRTCTGKC